MSANDFIHETFTGTANATLSISKSRHGIIVDNQSASELFYTLNNDDVRRRVPAGGSIGLPFSVPFTQVTVEANGYYEISTYL